MCKVEGCTNDKILAKGLCNKHYKQMYRHGKIIKTIYEPNDIVCYETYAEIILRDKHGEECARSLIDLEDVDLVSQYKWCLTSGDHVLCRKSNIFLHRLLLNIIDETIDVDHINRNPLDNRKENLRLATPQQNCMNKSIQTNNTSGVPGVSWRKDRNKWRAFITFNGKQISLGLYVNKEDAINARKEAEIKYFGEFAPKFDN
jgi:hypothetical protein